jgi:hypothetical protein
VRIERRIETRGTGRAQQVINQVIPGGPASGKTMLTLRVKLADARALADEQIGLSELRQRADLQAYVSQ